MRKIIVLSSIFMFLLSSLAWAQQVTMTGRVVSSEDGMGIPGASVTVRGTTIGTVTDFDGFYTLQVPGPESVLAVSFVGMATQEILVGNQTTINVTLAPDLVRLDEVVVVAYGIQRREAATGAVAVVREAEIRNIPATSPEKLLQGRMAGVQMQSVTGQPGSASQIRIRGFSSVNASNEPLYVIDGVPVASGNYSYFTSTGNILATMNPGDIESITVLKDAAASSVYGSRAANGVILITTKRGAAREATLNFRTRQGFSDLANDNNFRFMEAGEIYSYMRQAIINSGLNPATYPEAYYGAGFFAGETLPTQVGDKTVELYDWTEAAFRRGGFSEYELSATGGTEQTQYYTSGSFMKQEGIMIATGLERYSFRSNLDQKIGNILKIGSNLNASYTFQDDRPNESMYFVNPFWASISCLPWHPAYLEDGSYNFNIPSNSSTNFIAAADHEDQWDKAYKVLGSVYGELEPMEGLTIRSQNSIELLNSEGRRWWSPLADPNEDGTLQVSNRRLERYTTTNTINYMHTFADVHNFRALLGQEAFISTLQTHTAIGYNIGTRVPYLSRATQDNSRVNFGFSEVSLLSLFGIFDYNYDNKYFVTGSVRNDGNSKFGQERRYATFWSAGASWNIHRENFMNRFTFVDMLKLRGSFGINGNDGIGAYDQYGTYAAATYNGYLGAAPARIPNPELGWELNSTYNAGLDFALFGRLQGSLEYYHRTTSEMLLNMPLSRTTGESSMRINIGELINQGVEATVMYNIMSGPVNWNVRGNIARNKVELTDLGGEEEVGDGFWRRFRVGGGYSDYYVYDYAGVNPLNGLALYRTQAVEDDDGNVTEPSKLTHSWANAGRNFVGKIEPDFFGGFGTDVSWKGFNLSAFFEFKVGHYVYIMESRYTRSDGFNWGSNQNALALDYWKQPGDLAANPKPLVNNATGSNEWGTSRYLERGDYLRIKDVTLSYQLPRELTQRIRVSNARLFVNAVNLFTFHDVSYWDPERDVTGGNYIVFPQSKTFTFGIELGF